MKFRALIISFIILLILFFFGQKDTSYLGLTLIFDVVLILLFISFLSKKEKYVFPSSLFVFIFYIYTILGKSIYIYRELNWFNEEGDPNEIANYFSLIGVILIIGSFVSIQRRFKNKQDSSSTIEINISKETLVIFSIFTFIGAFLFTNQFTHIALFSEDMDATRVLTSKQSDGGRGIGFIFLTFGIIANSLVLIDFYKNRSDRNYGRILFFVVNTFFLTLYSGRFLPVIPLVIYLIVINEGKILKFSGAIKKITLSIVAFLTLMFFGARRAFGSDADFDLVFRFIIGDSFPEFRMTVYANHLTSNNYYDNFFYTLISGVIPGPFFSLIGLNKFDYFKPIGGEILKITHFDPVAIPGIRTSLFGELYFTGFFIPVFVIAMICLLWYLDRLFFREQKMNFRKFRILAGSIFLCFSIPYGSLFLVSCTHFFLTLYVTERMFFKKRKQFETRSA